MKRRENLKIPTSSPQTVNKHIILIYITKYTVNMKKLQKKKGRDLRKLQREERIERIKNNKSYVFFSFFIFAINIGK